MSHPLISQPQPMDQDIPARIALLNTYADNISALLRRIRDNRRNDSQIDNVERIFPALRDIILDSLMPPYRLPFDSIPRILKCLVAQRTITLNEVRKKAGLWLQDGYIDSNLQYILQQYRAAGWSGRAYNGNHYYVDPTPSPEIAVHFCDDMKLLQRNLQLIAQAQDLSPHGSRVDELVEGLEIASKRSRHSFTVLILETGPIHTSQLPILLQRIIVYGPPTAETIAQTLSTWLDDTHTVTIHGASWYDEGDVQTYVCVDEFGWVNVQQSAPNGQILKSSFLCASLTSTHPTEESMSAPSHNTEDKLVVSEDLGVNRSALSLDRGSAIHLSDKSPVNPKPANFDTMLNANPDELWRNLCRDLRQFSASIGSHVDEDAHPDLDYHSHLSALVLQLDQVRLERLRAQAQLSASIYDCE